MTQYYGKQLLQHIKTCKDRANKMHDDGYEQEISAVREMRSIAGLAQYWCITSSQGLKDRVAGRTVPLEGLNFSFYK